MTITGIPRLDTRIAMIRLNTA
ncbi:uncharacterized protein FRV6_10242 [Fusarium oxysporum]|uniref:Uncharacterized protein n=1 Tax=Fusarium oxysporum TaxID=5507 RepID=A0A2H3TEN3_FUSOX|nr:uncharacterized protein FRV6_10242 [Fusarium oxysporum]